MDAHAGRDIEAIRYARKARLLAGASCAALAIACWLPAPVAAGTHPVRNEAELRAAVAAANGDPDPSATILVTGNIVMASSINLDPPTKPITIDTQGFTITGTSGGGGYAVNFLSGSGSFTLVGSFVGGDAVGVGVAGGAGVRARSAHQRPITAPSRAETA